MRTKILLTMLIAAVAYGQQTPAEDEAQILALQERLRSALQMYTPAHPVVRQLQAELDAARHSSSDPLPDQWWKDPRTSTLLALTADQQKKLDMVFQEQRQNLIDRSVALEKAEKALAALMGEPKSEQSTGRRAIDLVAEARAELEKVRGRMLLEMRSLLTLEQWNKLRAKGLH